MENAEKLTEYIHKKIGTFRNILTLVSRPDFVHLYDGSDPGTRGRLTDCIIEGKLSDLKEWLRVKRLQEPENLGIRELRFIASKLGIQNYSQLSKGLLLSAIANARKPNKIDPIAS